MLKLCILALDQDADKITDTNKNSINIISILKTALELFPLDELELLSNISQKLNRENTLNQ